MMARRCALLPPALLLAASLAPLPGLARSGDEPSEPLGYVCYRAPGAIRVDGRLDDPGWKGIPWTAAFVDVEKGTKPRYRTRARMTWDERALYVAAELEEPNLWATFREHDKPVYQDNAFEIFIDPDGDRHDYYEWEVNALNTTWDLLLTRPYRDGGQAKSDWEIPGFQGAVQLRGTLNDARDRDRGWTLEVALPWKVLGEHTTRRVPPANGEQWRLNLFRSEWPLEPAAGGYRKPEGARAEFSAWSPHGAYDNHRPERFGVVQFATGRPGSARYRPPPDLAARSLLQEVHEAQRTYRQQNGRFARTLAELRLTELADPSLAGPLEMQVAGEEYTVSARLRGGGTVRLTRDGKVLRD